MSSYFLRSLNSEPLAVPGSASGNRASNLQKLTRQSTNISCVKTEIIVMFDNLVHVSRPTAGTCRGASPQNCPLGLSREFCDVKTYTPTLRLLGAVQV